MYVWVVYVYVFVYVHLHVSYVNVVGVCVACVCGGCPKHRDCANTLVLYIYIYIYMGQVIEKCTIGAGQAQIIKLTITLNNFITLEEQLIPFI